MSSRPTNQGAIARSDRHSLVAVDDFPEPPDRTMISDDAGQAFADPGAGLRPVFNDDALIILIASHASPTGLLPSQETAL
jgi:hypothetical protein